MLLGHITGHWEPEFLLFAWGFKYLFSASNTNKVINVIKCSYLSSIRFGVSLWDTPQPVFLRSLISLRQPHWLAPVTRVAWGDPAFLYLGIHSVNSSFKTSKPLPRFAQQGG